MAMFQAGSVIENVLSTVTSGGTLTLTITSPTYLQFTGTTTHTVVLPDATTLPKSKRFYIANRSTGIVSVQYDDASPAVDVNPDTENLVVLVDNSTSNGTWDISTGTGGGGGGPTFNVMSDWVDYSALVTVPAWAGTAVNVEYWGKRVGDTLYARGVVQCGNVTSADSTWFLPPGLTIDSSRFTQNVSDPTRDARHFLGPAYALLNTGTVIDNGTSFVIFYDKETDGIYITNSMDPGGTREFWIRPANGYINNDEAIAFEFQAPILEWADSSVDNVADTALRYTSTAGQSIPTSSITIIDYDTVNYDFYSLVTTGASWKATAKVHGIYDITAHAGYSTYNTNNNYDIFIYKNGTVYSRTSFAGDSTPSITDSVELDVGDYVDIRTSQDTGGSVALDTSPENLGVSIALRRKLIGPAQTVKVIAQNTNNQAFSTGVEATLLWNVEVQDTHNAFDGSTGIFTAPFDLDVQINMSLGFTVGPQSTYVLFRKNGVATYLGDTWAGGATDQSWMTPSGVIKLSSGDTIDFRAIADANTTVDTTFLGGAQVSIIQVP